MKGKKQNNRTKYIIAIVVACVVLAGLFIIYFLHKSDTDTTVQQICLGMIISILSSFLFFLLTDFVFKDETDILEIKENTEIIKKSEVLSSNIKRYGIRSIELIDYIDDDNDLWLNILNNADKKLDIIAHTLSPWFKEKYRHAFETKIVEIVNHDGQVKILILDPEGENLKFSNTGNDGLYKEKVIETIENLNNIYKQINFNKRKHLIIKLNSEYIIPYSYIRNDNNTYISPYLCSKDGRSSFITSFENGSKLAQGFNNDFEDIFKRRSMKVLDDVILIDTIKSKKNKYSSRDWNIENTNKYVFQVDDVIAEVGYYEHYMNSLLVDKTIELSTSYGCIYKCKYCASSQIDSFKILNPEQIMKMLDIVCELSNVDKKDNVVIAMTGIGDYRYTYRNVNKFILSTRQKYVNASFIVSSCAWNNTMIKEIEKLFDNGIEIKFWQWTYISYDLNKVESVIPEYTMDCNIITMVENIKNSKLSNKFRINYLMISDINDSDCDFDEFIKHIESVKENVLVRISKLNETSCSRKNCLFAAENQRLERLRDECNKKGIRAYIFKAYKNDNMNCGQLITDKKE